MQLRVIPFLFLPHSVLSVFSTRHCQFPCRFLFLTPNVNKLPSLTICESSPPFITSRLSAQKGLWAILLMTTHSFSSCLSLTRYVLLHFSLMPDMDAANHTRMIMEESLCDIDGCLNTIAGHGFEPLGTSTILDPAGSGGHGCNIRR